MGTNKLPLGPLLDTETAKARGHVPNVPNPVLWRWARNGLIPCVRIGRRVYWDPEALQHWRQAGGTPLGEPTRGGPA